LQVGLGVILAGIVLFVGLTRTQVGRDVLRSQIEAAFNQRYEGTLSIGTLEGTLVDEIVARKIDLRDPGGNVVATVDSVHAVPQWANLLTAQLSLQTLTIVHPQVSLARDASGSWNASRVLERRPSSIQSRPSLDVALGTVAVQDGRVQTTRDGPAPQSVQEGWIFDYTRTTVSDVSLRASVDRQERRSYVEIQSASFSLSDPNLQASSLQGIVRRTSTGWSVSEVDLSLESSRIRGDGSLTLNSTSQDPVTYSLNVERSRIDNVELQRLVPRLPLAESTTIEGSLQGTPSRLQVENVTVTHDSSFATVEGSVESAGDAFRVDLRLRESTLVPTDLREVWPGLPRPPNPEMGPFTLSGRVRGTASRAPDPDTVRSFDLDVTLDAQSPHGVLEGSAELTREQTGSASYSTSVRTRTLDLAPLTGQSELSSELTGTVKAQSTRSSAGSFRGEIDLSLASSQIAGRSVASAEAVATVTDQSGRGTLTVRQPGGGSLSTRAAVDSLHRRPRYEATLSSTNLDLAPLNEALPSTDLNANLTVRGAGAEWRPLAGSAALRVDSSRIYRGDSTVALPPHSATLQLNDRTTDRPRIEVSGTVGTVTIDGTTLGPPLWSTARIWATALRNAVQRERAKPAPSQTPSELSVLSVPDRPQNQSALRANAEDALTQLESPGPIDARASLRVQRPDVLHAWWASFPRRADNFNADAELTVGTDTLFASGSVSAARLQSGNNTLENIDIEYHLSTQFDEPLAQSTRVTAQAHAGHADLGGPAISALDVSLTYGDRSGRISVSADSIGLVDSLEASGTLRISSSTNELQLNQLSLGINSERWTINSPASVFAYSDALVFTPIRVAHPHPTSPAVQSIHVEGTLSARPTDTLSIRAQNVYMPTFSRAAATPRMIGGEVNADVHLQSAWGVPQLTGDASVQRLSYDRRILGNVRLHTEYSADSPDLLLDGEIRTPITTVDSLTGPSLVPAGAQAVDPNRLSWTGRIQLPSWATSDSEVQNSALPPGETLDLSVEVERADLFFFRYIFEERVSRVRGYATGPLHIGGRFQDPIFNADLSILNGAVSLPLFGLDYQVEGAVEVDERGIHPDDLEVQDGAGSATVNGSIFFNEYQYFSFDLSSTLDEMTVIDVPESENLPFYGSIRASGPLRLTGPLSDASLSTNDARTTPDSELYIPLSGTSVEDDSGYIVFADSTGRAPVQTLTRRQSIFGDRPQGVPTFVDGLNLDLNVTAPSESTVHLVFDPLVGDVVTLVGSGRVQLLRQEGDFSVFGNFDATNGTYQFTAGEVFVRRFNINAGSISWDGSPTNATLDLNAEYRTRASPSGLPGFDNFRGRIPVTVQLAISGRVATPQVDLSLSLSRQDAQNPLIGSESLDAVLNDPAQTTEYATSVLLTNTFLLTTESSSEDGSAGNDNPSSRLTRAGNQFAFNSVSQLVSSQLNRYLGQAFPNVDLNFGIQGEEPENLDLIYGVALRLLNERLIIRGEGIYTGDEADTQQTQGPQGEFVVEVRLSPNVSANFFYRRTGDELSLNRVLTSSRGAGVSYQTRFSNWKSLFGRLFGWLLPSDSDSPKNDRPDEPVASETPAPDSSSVSGRPR